MEPKRNKIKDSDTENNLMVARREGSGGLGEKVKVNKRYKLTVLK